jgi:hypothetical protein
VVGGSEAATPQLSVRRGGEGEGCRTRGDGRHKR